MLESILFWGIGSAVWLLVFLWNVDSWNKSRMTKNQAGEIIPAKEPGLLKPIRSYFSEYAFVCISSLLATAILLTVGAFDQLPVKVLIGGDETVGKLFLGVVIAFNVEALINAIRRNKAAK